MNVLEQARRLFVQALEAVRPEEALRRHLTLEGEVLWVGGERFDLSQFERIRVMAIGKAAPAMAAGLEALLGSRIAGGLVVGQEGAELLAPQRLEVMAGPHPVPDPRSLEAARRLFELADAATERDLVVVLISGGGSALVEEPAGRLALEHLQHLTSLLLVSGATVEEMNAVRKHVSAIKGGRLLERIHPATCLTLALSDVVGSPPDVIASGPTVADRSSYAEALRVLERYQLLRDVPPAVLWHLQAGAAGEFPETVHEGAPCLDRSRFHVVGDNRLLAEGALRAARDMGYHGLLLTTWLEGEAREAGRFLAGIARQIQQSGEPVPRPACLVASGEVPVTVRGQGRGGRCHELALAFAIAVQGLPGITLLAATSDGHDGGTDSAGALVDGQTVARGAARGLDAEACLRENDSYSYFRDLDELLKIGLTGTNTNDLFLLLVSEPGPGDGEG